MKNNKTLFKHIVIGLKYAWDLPSLPESVNIFHSYPLTRIFRVIGGISIILILFLSSPSWIGDYFLYWIIFTLAMLHFIYIIVISFIKLYYIVYLWRNNNLEVINTDLDHVATLTIKLAVCIKGACVAGIAIATILGLGFGADKLLQQAGHPSVFQKVVGNQLGNILFRLGYKGHSKYLELKKKMFEVKVTQKTSDEIRRDKLKEYLGFDFDKIEKNEVNLDEEQFKKWIKEHIEIGEKIDPSKGKGPGDKKK